MNAVERIREFSSMDQEQYQTPNGLLPTDLQRTSNGSLEAMQSSEKESYSFFDILSDFVGLVLGTAAGKASAPSSITKPRYN